MKILKGQCALLKSREFNWVRFSAGQISDCYKGNHIRRAAQADGIDDGVALISVNVTNYRGFCGRARKCPIGEKVNDIRLVIQGILNSVQRFCYTVRSHGRCNPIHGT